MGSIRAACACQSAPRALGCCAGVRRSIGDLSFQTLVQNPQFSAAWSGVESTLHSEGASALDVLGAQDVMANAFSTATEQLGYNGDQALSAATQLTIAGQTIGGAVAQVEGLVNVAKGGDPGAIVQTFTGTLVAAAVAAGAVSAGVGALVVAGAALVGAALDSLLGGGSKPGYQVCSSNFSNPPTYVVGCLASFSPAVSPGAYSYKPFPDPKVKGDAWWFGLGPNASGFASFTDWHGAHFAAQFHSAPFPGSAPGVYLSSGFVGTPALPGAPPMGPVGARPIDDGWPDYQLLANDAQVPDPRAPDFQPGLFQAWKANAQLQLNGCNSAKWSDVLLHFVRTWNRAHDGSSYIDVHPASYLSPQPGKAGGPATPSKIDRSWAATQIAELQHTVGPDTDPANPVNYMRADGSLRIYTGARKVPPRPVKIIALHLGPPPPKKVIALHLGPRGAVGAKAPASAPMSTGAKVAGVAGAGAGAAVLWWFASHGWRWVTPRFASRLLKK
jgi:hypothetical protein